MSKKYQAGKKEGRSLALWLVGFLVMIFVMLIPVFQLWGSIWWIDAIAILVVVMALGAFALGGSIFLSQSSLELLVDNKGLGAKDWRNSWSLPWTEVSAWCAVEVEDGARLICLKSSSDKKPISIEPELLRGNQFARIYYDIQEHCGPPSPGSELLGDNEGEPFTDKRPGKPAA